MPYAPSLEFNKPVVISPNSNVLKTELDAELMRPPSQIGAKLLLNHLNNRVVKENDSRFNG